MPIVRPVGILCDKWEPTQLGSKRCRYYIEPSGTQREGLCHLPTELLCVEWVRRNGTDAQKDQLAARGMPPSTTQPQGSPSAVRAPAVDADPPPLVLRATEPLPPRPPARVRTAGGGEVAFAPPRPYEPAKEVDPASLEALERAGVEVELAAPYLETPITLVQARTGRTDRSEVTWREAATIRLIVDCFPGAHVTAYRAGNDALDVAARALHSGVTYEESMAALGPRRANDPTLNAPFESFPLEGTRCSDCGEPQRRTPGGLCCANGHGGADPLAEEEDPLS